MSDAVQMSDSEAWDYLATHEFGRLAFHLAEQVHIAPINYAIYHDPASDQRTLLFRTAEGSKLLGIVMNDDVAFEVDEFGEEEASSVILRGLSRSDSWSLRVRGEARLGCDQPGTGDGAEAVAGEAVTSGAAVPDRAGVGDRRTPRRFRWRFAGRGRGDGPAVR